MKPNPRIFLSAGEASGDAYGAALIDTLTERLPGAAFTGLGGSQMERAGQQRVVRAEEVAVMGVTEILRHIPHIYASYRKLVRSIRANRPDIAVLIDFPDVNFRLAKHLHRAGVPVVWFVSPQLWAWKRRRLRWVQQRVDKMLVIFPFEERFYRERGVDAQFVGHPLAELPLPSISREAYAEQHELDPAKTWIALLPGSRWKEIRANLPTLQELAMSDLIASSAAYTTFDGNRVRQPRDPAAHTLYEFLLPVASTIDPTRLRIYINQLNAEHLKYFGPEASRLRLTLVPNASEALFHARASVVASGTATVLAAIVGNPFIVVYRVSALTFALAKKLVEYPSEFPNMLDLDGNLPVAMVNLIAERRIVPELLQSRFTAANVASALSPLLAEGPERETQIAALAKVRNKLRATDQTEGSPINRLAEAVVDLLSTEQSVSP
ncbi:lipid-A-disaccharide synthase [Granulicella sp. S156]|uniref:lipid-A-disaccharide synthase n=1 Tax=Granulicella sp. S156 TaxID=1747224 RepID=UPI0020B16261|nr:lipid-A-disaccharide synthase [Granulicella sp. S156]